MIEWRVVQARVERFCKHYHGQQFHALLCDPPYNLAFMGKDWDKGGIAFKPETWAALAEHLLSGAFGMTFASARGWHRVACAIEDAGLRLHPTIFCWAFGSGFPKATRIDAQIDKAAGETQEMVGPSRYAARRNKRPRAMNPGGGKRNAEDARVIMEPATDLARAWAGHRYGLQAMKPAIEPIIVFQKPYEGKPVDSIVKHGAGSLNIEAGRILGTLEGDPSRFKRTDGGAFAAFQEPPVVRTEGRWPANFAVQHHPNCQRVGVKKIKNLSGSVSGKEPSKPAKNVYGEYGRHSFERHADADGLETVEEWQCVEACSVRRLDEQSGKTTASKARRGTKREVMKAWREMEGRDLTKSPPLVGKAQAPDVYGDPGGASRFFFNSNWNAETEEGILSADPVQYCAKAARKERDAGLEARQAIVRTKKAHVGIRDGILNTSKKSEGGIRTSKPIRNSHPTVKPIKLCRWLASLLLPPDAYAPRRILVPFAGVGSEMIAAALEGWEAVVGIEMEGEYTEIAKARLQHWLCKEKQGKLWPISE